MKFKIHVNNFALIKAFAINRKYIRKKKKRRKWFADCSQQFRRRDGVGLPAPGPA